jgi:hypothetical protein
MVGGTGPRHRIEGCAGDRLRKRRIEVKVQWMLRQHIAKQDDVVPSGDTAQQRFPIFSITRPEDR